MRDMDAPVRVSVLVRISVKISCFSNSFINLQVAKLVVTVKASEFLALDDKEENVHRTTVLPDSDVTIPRSIMSEKFPPDSTIEDLFSFVNNVAPVLSVRLIKEFEKTGTESKDGEFKGEAFIDFDSEESENKVLVQELSYKDDKLTLKSKEEHVKMMKKAYATPDRSEDEDKDPHRAQFLQHVLQGKEHKTCAGGRDSLVRCVSWFTCNGDDYYNCFKKNTLYLERIVSVESGVETYVDPRTVETPWEQCRSCHGLTDVVDSVHDMPGTDVRVFDIEPFDRLENAACVLTKVVEIAILGRLRVENPSRKIASKKCVSTQMNERIGLVSLTIAGSRRTYILLEDASSTSSCPKTYTEMEKTEDGVSGEQVKTEKGAGE